LRSAGKYFLIALPAKTTDATTGWSGAFDYAAIAGAADLYSRHGVWVSDQRERRPRVDRAPRVGRRDDRVRRQPVPTDRLLLGVPFYG
jgi:hypothetical protein